MNKYNSRNSILMRFAIGNLLVALFICTGCQDKEKTVEPKPNIVFLLVDDLGWKDLACYGSDFYETPNIDRLAAQGMLFTNAYAAASICSPTRASILTGKYPARINITDWIPGYDPKNKPLLGTKDKHELPLEEITFPESLKSSGYNTAFLGKWHLGEPGYFPEDQGFDVNIGGHWAGQPASYFYPYKNDRKRWDVPGLEGGEEGEYLTDRLTKESIHFIEENKANPFLLYLAYYNVHTPIQAKEEYIQKYQAKLDGMVEQPVSEFREEGDARSQQSQINPTYAGMVQSVDESVGNILKKLEDEGLTENTIIVFTSDNGGLTTLSHRGNPPTAVAPLRAGKGWLYEGGIRVPSIVKWPGTVQANSICDEPIISTDFYPTILDVVNLDNPVADEMDGKSLLPLLKEEVGFSRTALYWHFPHYHGSLNRPSAAVRLGDYKLIEWMEDGKQELYNLKNDIGELEDLSDSMVDKKEELAQLLHDWQGEIGALMPTKNPAFVETSE